MGLFSKLISKITGNSPVAESEWAELEKSLLESDLGRELSAEILSSAKKIKESPELALTSQLNSYLSSKSRETKPGVILIVGVNGTGKTTSAAKLANALPGKNLLAAADTFRAAAVEQLQSWGKKLEIEVIAGNENGDPASVAFDATKKFSEGFDNLIIDTAGRLHNKADLMAELGKVKRVIEKSQPISEVFLVIDATTGQNGLTQAEVFTEAVEVTGIILTKTDGSAKGGIALAIEKRFDIPIKWVANGESVNNFAPFVNTEYINSLIY